MATTKTYTLKENMNGSHSRQHRLVRAAWAKGLTDIIITWYPSRGYHLHKGWYLQATDFPERNIGFEVQEAENRINQIDATVIA